MLSATVPSMQIGDRIRKARAGAGLSQRELANAIKVTHGTVGQWESHRKRPTRDNLHKIAQVTLTSFEELARGIPDLEGVLVKDERQLMLLRRFGLMSVRQQDNLLELLGVAVDLNRSLQDPRHPSESRPPTISDGHTTPR